MQSSREHSASEPGRPARRKGPISGLVRGIASGIGLASESYHNHQEKKKARTAVSEASTEGELSRAGNHGLPSHREETISSNSDASDDSDDHEAKKELDEAAWQLDDAQLELAPPPDYDTATGKDDSEAMASYFLSQHPPNPQQTAEQQPLAVPVIIPQRRPGERARGFIRAYSPALESVGIDQCTFMDFIRDLNLATMPSPWINAINVASIAVQHVPEPVTIAVSIAAHFATQATLQVHSRTKTNAFMDKLNAEFFRPRGLIAVILTWKPSSKGEIVTQARFDAAIEHAAESTAVPQAGMTSTIRNRMQASHGITNFEWPVSAPLVFPELDKLADANEGQSAIKGEAQKANGVQRSMIFAMEYMDKRGQAKWAADHPDSGLASLGVKPEFHSRYADPNHPASSGSLLALLTGGAIGGQMGGRKQARRERIADKRGRRQGRRAQRREARGPTVLGTIGPLALIRGVKKIMHEVPSSFFQSQNTTRTLLISRRMSFIS